MKKRIGQTLTAWIACIAILFAAMSPPLAHAYASTGDGLWAQICSASGTKLVKIDDGKDAGAMQKHCPFCSLHGDLLDVLPSPAWSLLVIQDAVCRVEVRPVEKPTKELASGPKKGDDCALTPQPRGKHEDKGSHCMASRLPTDHRDR